MSLFILYSICATYLTLSTVTLCCGSSPLSCAQLHPDIRQENDGGWEIIPAAVLAVQIVQTRSVGTCMEILIVGRARYSRGGIAWVMGFPNSVGRCGMEPLISSENILTDSSIIGDRAASIPVGGNPCCDAFTQNRLIIHSMHTFRFLTIFCRGTADRSYASSIDR